jgi:UDP:flavonoid glycosyltransferase YjiC (YdhE family)
MKIAFLGVRVPGHLNPMTTLARKLKARGHDVVFMIDHPRELTELLPEYAPTE